MKDVCHVYEKEHDARRRFDEFLRNNVHKVIYLNGVNHQIVTKDGYMHWFMGESKYCQWCKGRTYYIDNMLYHSGYIIMEVSDEITD